MYRSTWQKDRTALRSELYTGGTNGEHDLVEISRCRLRGLQGTAGVSKYVEVARWTILQVTLHPERRAVFDRSLYVESYTQLL